MAVTTISRTQQIKPTTGYAWIANNTAGVMTDFSITANRAIETDANGSPAASVTTSTELGYVSGVTSSIQIQLNGKASVALDNLSSVAINTSLIDDTDNMDDLGSDAIEWKDIWAYSLKHNSVGTPNLTIAVTGNNGSISLSPNGTGTVDVNSKKITSLATPTTGTDAANKDYVDSLANGLSWKQAARLGSVADIPGSDNAGTITISNGNATYFPVAGAAKIDGVGIAVNDRILVKDQTLPKQNGIYKVTVAGVQGSVDAVLVRALDMDTWAEVPAAAVVVEEGTVNSDKAFVCTSDQGGTIDVTAITFVKFSSVIGTLTLTDAHIFVGNGSNIATDVAVSGDLTLADTGAFSIAPGISNHLVTRETPSGTINGSNVTFTLAFTPSPVGSEQIYLNGLLQQAGVSADYTISGVTITFNVAPEGGSRLLAIYWK